MLQRKYLVFFYQNVFLNNIFRLCKYIFSQNFFCVVTGLKKIEKIKVVLIFAKKNLGGALFLLILVLSCIVAPNQ